MIRSFILIFISLVFGFPAIVGWTDWADLGGAGYSDPAAVQLVI